MPAIARWILRLGPTNPICVRLVQGGSRRMKHFYIRTGYLAVLIVVLLWTLLVGAGGGQLSYSDLANAGAFSFQIIAYLQIGLICVLAPVFMAGAIAQEAPDDVVAFAHKESRRDGGGPHRRSSQPEPCPCFSHCPQT